MQPLVLSDAKARQLYPTAPAEWKQVLEDSFGKEFFSLKITDRINSFEDACTINGTDPGLDKFAKGSADTIAYEKLKEIAKAYREGVELSYKNTDQQKWYPLHKYSPSGFRFDFSHFVFTSTSAPVGLCVDTEEKANDFGQKFIHLFEQYKN